MGRPKLLLPVEGEPVIVRLLRALEHPYIRARVVVTRTDDTELQQLVQSVGGIAVSPPCDPPDMRASIEFGLQSIVERWQPTNSDGWLMVPADHPQLTPTVVAALIAEYVRLRPQWVLPVCRGRRGHPLLGRWETTSLLKTLPHNLGLNALLRQSDAEIHEVLLPDEGILADLDTPADYHRLLGNESKGEGSQPLGRPPKL